MTKKPSYEELEQKVKDLEKACLRPEQDEDALRETENALRISEQRYRLLAENVVDNIWLLNLDTLKLTFCSPSVTRILGYTDKELVNNTFGLTLTAETMKVVMGVLEEELAREGRNGVEPNRSRALELEQIHKNGSTVWTEITATFIRNENGKATDVLGVTRDITERKQMEEALRESKERYRAIFEQAADPIILIDPDTGALVEFNDPAFKNLGLSIEEFGKLKTDNFITDFNISLSPEEIAQLTAKVLQGEPQSFEITLGKNKDDIHYAHIKARAITVHGKRLIHAIVRDISELKKTEEEKSRLQRQLLQTQKMELVGTLAGGIAHDFNNLLGGILGYIELAYYDSSPGSSTHEFLSSAKKVCLTAKDLTSQFITFSKGGLPVKNTGSIVELIKNTAILALSGSRIRCEFMIPDDLWPIDHDEAQLRQAFSRLVINAKEAMPDGGVLNIDAENVIIGDEFDKDLTSGKYLKLAFRDHGVGISGENISKIFDPYFTTKEMGSEKGMGLGLTIAYSIISKHGGAIKFESKPGVGTNAFVYLPVSQQHVVHKKTLTKQGVGGKPKVLLMDDEEIIRDVISSMLDRMGYNVQAARDGNEAVEIFKQARASGKPFDIVILDLTVKGGMGGRSAIEEILKIDPGIKAVVSSGYSDDTAMTNYKKYGFKAAIAKPYQYETLKDILSELVKE